ncbi:MAG: hypothetical protein NTV52_10085 [Acidobacteria bacterium]|nr:hypothetical protein [Acidobacteriota bacterium]
MMAQTPTLTVVSAATYERGGLLAPGMIATAFSSAITETGGYSIVVGENAAATVAVSAGQASFVLPAGLADGPATVALRRGGETVATAGVRIGQVAPGIFTANASGEGAPAGFAVYGRFGGQRQVDLFERFTGSARWEPTALDVGDETQDVHLVLFGTGFRNAAAGRVTASAGGVSIPVQAAQAHSVFAGLDQLNLGPLPRELAGKRGQLELVISVEGVAANRTLIAPTSPASGGWGGRAGLPEANSEMGVVGLNGKIYVIGGYPSTRVSVNVVQVYDTATNSWSLAAPLPVALNHLMPAAFNGKVYAIGGQTDTNTAYVNTVYEYDPATNTWRTRAPMPTARSAGAAAVIDGKIYVAGGRPPRGADFAVYDPARDEWTTLPNLPTQRNHLMALGHEGKLYVVGGRFDGGFTSLGADAVEIFDPKPGLWTKGAAMPKARGGLNGVSANGCMHFFGGEFATGVHPDHDVYNPRADRWTSLPNMPQPVHGVTGLHFQDGLIYLPGGGTMQGGSSGSRLHQVYRPNLSCP